jgi:hypothetical protein
MPNHDPNFGVAFVVGIFVVVLMATLFPEKEPESKSADQERLNEKSPTDGAGE